MSNNFQSNNKSKMNSSMESKTGSTMWARGMSSESHPPTRNQMGARGGMHRETPPPTCKVCIAAGKADFNHFVKNLDGTTNCPTLLSQSCRYCKEPGHTTKYCPVLAQHKKEDDMLLRRASNATTPLAGAKTMIKPSFTSANAFSALDDSDEETQSSKKMKTKSSQQMDSRGSQPPNNGNKHSTTIKTNNFSITGSPKTKQAEAEAFPSLPKSDKPNYAAIAAKAEANERSAKIQKEKEAKEAKLREEQASLVQITGLAGQKVVQQTQQKQAQPQSQPQQKDYPIVLTPKQLADTCSKREYPTMLTTEELADFQACGDYIYDYIGFSHKLIVDCCKTKLGINITLEEVQEFLSAGKITGMLMELEHAEVIELIKHSKDLDNRLADAVETINQAFPLPAKPVSKPVAKVCTWAQEEDSEDEEAVPEDNSAW